MGFFGRLSNGWELGKHSLSVVWSDKSLTLFPLVSGVAWLGMIAAYYFGIGPEQMQNWLKIYNDTEEIPKAAIAAAFALYFSLSFVIVYFNVALMGAVGLSLDGKDTNLWDGIKVANSHLPSILLWSVISGSVGLILNAIENSEKGGEFIRSILGTIWSVITYFVIPVMIFERKNAFSSIGGSINVMKNSWGENVAAQFSIGLYTFLFCLPVILLFFLMNIISPFILIAIAVVYIAAVTLISQTAKSVLIVVLYRYATGQQSKGFDSQSLDNAFH